MLFDFYCVNLYKFKTKNMIKKLLFMALTFCAISISAQNFNGMYHFSSVTQSTGLVDPTPTPTAAGLSFGSFSAVGTPSQPSASGAFCFDAWDGGATNASDITFTGSEIGRAHV